VSSLLQPFSRITAGAALTGPQPPELPEWLRELYPFRTRTLQVSGEGMSFIEEGPEAAPPVVLVHGSPSWSFLFRDLVRRLRANYRIIAPDHIGFGLSTKPLDPEYHSLRRHISNFAALLEALEPRNITLVAHGWGGPIALAYAGAHPKNIARLVLVNTWAGNLPDVTKIKVPLGLRIAARGRIGEFLDRLLNLSLNSTFSSVTPLPDLTLEGYGYPFPNAGSRVGIRAFTRMFFAPDAETSAAQEEILAGLKNVEAPADILGGAHDPLLTKLPAYVLRDNLRHASEPVFLEAAHYIPEDAPDALAETILRTRQKASDGPTGIFNILG